MYCLCLPMALDTCKCSSLGLLSLSPVLSFLCVHAFSVVFIILTISAWLAWQDSAGDWRRSMVSITAGLCWRHRVLADRSWSTESHHARGDSGKIRQRTGERQTQVYRRRVCVRSNRNRSNCGSSWLHVTVHTHLVRYVCSRLLLTRSSATAKSTARQSCLVDVLNDVSREKVWLLMTN